MLGFFNFVFKILLLFSMSSLCFRNISNWSLSSPSFDKPAFTWGRMPAVIVFNCSLSFKTSFVWEWLFVSRLWRLSKNIWKLKHPISQNIRVGKIEDIFLFFANKTELLNWKIGPISKLDSFKVVRTGGSVPSAKVISVHIYDSISFPKREMIELNIYLWQAVRRASEAFTTKQTASMKRTPLSPCGENKWRIWSMIPWSRSTPLVSPNPGVSMTFRV